MCGRYALEADIDQLIERYKAILGERETGSSKEVFPTNRQAIVIDHGQREIKSAVWGFSPSFAKRPLINARGETVDKKPTFRKSFFTSRCIVPATSFFEWENVDGKKIRRRISLKESGIFSMAGLLSEFKDKEGNPFWAYTIITRPANDQMKSIHHRMPVILPNDKEGLWLNNDYKDIDDIKDIMVSGDLSLTID